MQKPVAYAHNICYVILCYAFKQKIAFHFNFIHGSDRARCVVVVASKVTIRVQIRPVFQISQRK